MKDDPVLYFQTELAITSGWKLEHIQSWHRDKTAHFMGFFELQQERQEEMKGTGGGNKSPSEMKGQFIDG